MKFVHWLISVLWPLKTGKRLLLYYLLGWDKPCDTAAVLCHTWLYPTVYSHQVSLTVLETSIFELILNQTAGSSVWNDKSTALLCVPLACLWPSKGFWQAASSLLCHLLFSLSASSSQSYFSTQRILKSFGRSSGGFLTFPLHPKCGSQGQVERLSSCLLVSRKKYFNFAF